ncbi:MAG: hypothetical protein OEV06_01315 [Anaerolineae bacterium]|nr:hypothetical protein [Anaerolineae bacterium]
MTDNAQFDDYDNQDESADDESYSWDWSLGGSNSWIWGALLILAGGLLLLQTFYPEINVINAGNWWALFILVPGVNMIGRGWRVFRRSGRLWGPFLWGILMVGFALSQLLQYSVGDYIWPVFLILGGLVLLFGGKRN